MRSIIYVDCVREEYCHRLQHWIYYTHVPDSINKFAPYCNKYTFYNALPVPPEGERFGTRRMQMTEHYWMVNEMTPEMSVNSFAERMPPEVLRWPCEKTGEKWFNEVFVPYFQNRPEVNRFVSSRIYHDVVGCQFHRLVEMWFDGPEEWYAAAVEGTKDMARPDWAKEAPDEAPQAKFPFLKPNHYIVGMFLSDMAASDNLTQYRGYLTMR